MVHRWCVRNIVAMQETPLRFKIRYSSIRPTRGNSGLTRNYYNRGKTTSSSVESHVGQFVCHSMHTGL